MRYVLLYIYVQITQLQVHSSLYLPIFFFIPFARNNALDTSTRQSGYLTEISYEVPCVTYQR